MARRRGLDLTGVEAGSWSGQCWIRSYSVVKLCSFLEIMCSSLVPMADTFADAMKLITFIVPYNIHLRTALEYGELNVHITGKNRFSIILTFLFFYF